MIGRSGGGLGLAAVKYKQPASHQPFHRLGFVFAQRALHPMPGRAMRQHMRQFMQQGGELLALGEAPAQQDLPAMRGTVDEIRAFAPSDRRAQGGGKRLQGVQIMLWDARCVHGGPHIPGPSIRLGYCSHERRVVFRTAIGKRRLSSKISRVSYCID
jgi:hypothetical protein